MPSSLNSAVHNAQHHDGTSSSGVSPTTQISHTPAFNPLQTLSMPMTISQPQPINAGGMM